MILLKYMHYNCDIGTCYGCKIEELIQGKLCAASFISCNMLQVMYMYVFRQNIASHVTWVVWKYSDNI
jgi:hypothetical protein